MAFTVTGTTNNGAENIAIKVFVVTGGSETGGAALAAGGFGNPSFSFTPNNSGSVIVEGGYEASNNATAITPNANNTIDDQGQTVGNKQLWWDGHYTGTVTGGVAVTLGGTNQAQTQSWCAYEVIPSGTAAIDASTPAAVLGSASSATTASFNPPLGAVLVAFLLTNVTASNTFGVSDTRIPTLTWTQRAIHFQGGFSSSVAVWTAALPAPPPAAAASALGGGKSMLGRSMRWADL